MRAEDSAQEFALIREYLTGLDNGAAVALGNGDDAALLRLEPGEELAVSADSMAVDRHFPAGSAADRVSYRAVAAAASDLAAMGARPLAMTLALSLPDADRDWLRLCRDGLSRACADFALPLVGGDLVRGPLSLTVQVMGAVRSGEALRRSGARVGDALYVSGTLGDAAAGLALLQRRLPAVHTAAAEALLESFWRPRPELELGITLRGTASAAIDVSDGLLADAGHLAAASGLRLVIESARLPLSPALCELVAAEQALDWALAGGEDYRLCFTAAPGSAPPHCTQIGHVEKGSGVACDLQPAAQGFAHF